MALIKTYSFSVKGKPYDVKINCTSTGVFTANIPKEIAQPLGLEEKLAEKTLNDVLGKLQDAIQRFKKAETYEELFIGIRYRASGFYNGNKNGDSLFGYDSGFASRSSYDDTDYLGFEFEVLIKEVVGGVETWHKTFKGSDRTSWMDEGKYNPDQYYKRTRIYGVKGYKIIPFSDEALANLVRTREAIRAASELLHSIVSKSEAEIEQAFTQSNLLTFNKQINDGATS